MIRGIYATATGMRATQTEMDIISNNLANLSTTGFKRDGVAFSDAMERELFANGGLGERLGKLGSGPTQARQFTVFDIGSITGTGNALDVAINTREGAFAVLDKDGTMKYTRNGSFAVDENRTLVTKAGLPVLDDSGREITLPDGVASIATDGTISVADQPVAKLGVFDGTFVKTGGNLFASPDAQLMNKVDLRTRALEGSNVNAIEVMVKLITLNRNFELSQKSIQQQDSLTQRLIQSLQEK